MSLSNITTEPVDYNYILFIRDFIILQSVQLFYKYHYKSIIKNADNSITMNDALFFFINPYNDDNHILLWNRIFNQLYFLLQYFYQLCSYAIKNNNLVCIDDVIHIDRKKYPDVYEKITYERYFQLCFYTSESWKHYSNTTTYNENLYTKYKLTETDKQFKNFIINEVFGIIYCPNYLENQSSPHSFIYIQENNTNNINNMVSNNYYLNYSYYAKYLYKHSRKNPKQIIHETNNPNNSDDFRFIYLENNAITYINQFI